MKAQTPTATASPETIAFRAALDVVGAALPEVADSIRQELADQRSHLKLIASENFASPAVTSGPLASRHTLHFCRSFPCSVWRWALPRC